MNKEQASARKALNWLYAEAYNRANSEKTLAQKTVIRDKAVRERQIVLEALDRLDE